MKLKFKLTIVVLLVTQLSFAQVVGGILDITGKMLVKNIVKTISDELQTLINEIDNAYSRNAFETKQNIELLIANLENSTLNILDKTFDELQETEKAFFKDLNNSLASLRELESDIFEDINNTVDQFSSTLTRIPFSNKEPHLSNFSPRFFLADDDLNDINVVLRGSILHNETPTLKLAGKGCALLSKTTNELKFKCDGSRIKDKENYKDLSADLDVWTKKGCFIFKKTKKVPFKVSMENIPHKMGIIKVKAFTEQIDRHYIKQTERKFEANKYCTESRNEFTWNILPKKSGYKIDVSTISIKIYRKTGHSGLLGDGIYVATENGFQIRGSLRNNGGPCVKLFGEYIVKDEPGRLGVDVTWYEFKETINSNPIDLPNETFYWKKGKSIELPENTEAFQLTIEQEDGSIFVINNERDAFETWFNVEFNKTNNVLLINPKSLEEVLD